MLTDPTFMNMLEVLDKRAQKGRNYGFRQNLWREIIEELRFLNDIAAYIDEQYPEILDEAEIAVMKAMAYNRSKGENKE